MTFTAFFLFLWEESLKMINVDYSRHYSCQYCRALHLPELKLSKKAVEMSQRVLHAVRVQVEVSQGLVSGDGADFLQVACQVLGQGPHCYTLNLSVHDDGAGSQTLHENTHIINHPSNHSYKEIKLNK